MSWVHNADAPCPPTAPPGRGRHRAQKVDSEKSYGRLVRLFALTGGRTEPSRDVFNLITLVTASEKPADTTNTLQPEHSYILQVCSHPTAVIEVAARLGLPVSVIKVILCDMLDAGSITARPPRDTTTGQQPDAPDIALLKRVREGLARL